MSRYFLLVSTDQEDVDSFLADLPADAELIRDWFVQESGVPALLFKSDAPIASVTTATPATPEPVNVGWHIGQRVKVVGGLSHLMGLEGTVRAVFLSEESDDDDQVAREGIVAKMDGRPFPQVVVKFDNYRRRIRYSGAPDLLKLQVLA